MKFDPRKPRGWTTAVLEGVDNCMLDKDTLIRDLLNFMSDAEVAAFVSQYGYSDSLGIDEEDDDE